MKVNYVRIILFIFLAGTLLPAQNQQEPRQEFFFAELAGEGGGPNGFLLNHAAQQSWPAEIDNAFRAEAVGKARKSFDQVKFRGLSRGRQGVWQTAGPVTEADESSAFFLEPGNATGRVTALAIGNSCSQGHCRLYVGTAAGGVWRTDRALHPSNPGWEYLSGIGSNNIGALTLDPNDPSGLTLYVGTGEANFNYTSGAGRGVFHSTDGGDSFSKLPTMITDLDVSPDPIDFTLTRGISQVAVKPGDPGTIYVATTTALLGMTSVRGGQATITGGPQAKVGLYRTTDGGATWELLFEAPLNTASNSGTPPYIFEILSGVKDVQLDPRDPDTVYITVADDGIYRSSPALDGDASFRKVFEIVGTNTDDSVAMFDLTVKAGATRIYAYNGNGVELAEQHLYRVDDADVPAIALFDGVSNTAAWLQLTSPSILQPGAFTGFRVCNAQCVYDLVVAVPEGRPDTVYVGGQLTPVLGDSTVRSTDAGVSFHSFAIDVQNPPGVPHVDVRAIAFHPSNPDIVFVGSDGGVVRSDGLFGDGSGQCALFGFPDGSPPDVLCETAFAEVPHDFVFMNRGLQAMQLYNISADPNRPLKRMMAGTQDNSTQWHDGTKSAKNWSKVFGIGDGTSANGFHPTNPNILFASFQSNFFFTHFDNGRGGTLNWTFTSLPILLSGERSDPVGPSGRQFMTFDPNAPDTQYTGFEHVWRTLNNGGDQAFLEANCTVRQIFIDGVINFGCGDWRPLGQNLVDGTFGDRAGGVVVAAERSRADAGTLWAATSLGRVFVTQNVNAADPTVVSFDRVDSAATPPRFISGIAVDHENPNRAFISYSGFNALTPATPGHVFEVVFDPDTSTATFTALDSNLGDIPINHVVRDDLTGDLYAATDFGVLVLPNGANAWELAGAGLPEVLTPHLEIHPQHRLLFAATHGLGAWYMNLSKVQGE